MGEIIGPREAKLYSESSHLYSIYYEIILYAQVSGEAQEKQNVPEEKWKGRTGAERQRFYRIRCTLHMGNKNRGRYQRWIEG